MLRLAVVGRNVESSQSPRIHTFLLGQMGEECVYEKRSLSERELFPEKLFGQYDALNVTAPYKRTFLPYLGRLGEEARSVGAVNFILTESRTGYNTDGRGFSEMLSEEGILLSGRRVLVLGAGGAGRACVGALLRSGAEVFVYSRTYSRVREAYQALGRFTALREIDGEYDLIVNCTGVGMNETEGRIPEVVLSGGRTASAEELFSRCGAAVDLIYEPKRSAFLCAAERRGLKTVNGAAMLFYQAYFADCILLGRMPDCTEARLFYANYQKIWEEKP